MESGVLKAVLLFLPVLAYIVWQIVSLHRDPELRQASSRNAAGDRDASPDRPSHQSPGQSSRQSSEQ